MLWVVLAVFLIPLIVLAATLHYNEDIMDFLPITAEEKETLHNMQALQSAAQIVLIIEGEDEAQRLDAIDAIDEKLY
jgi:predicted RND superfamily exporter protein